MSLIGLGDEKKVIPQTSGTFKGNYSTAGEVFSATLKEARLNSNSNSVLESQGFALRDFTKKETFSLPEDQLESLGQEESDLRNELSELSRFGSFTPVNTDESGRIEAPTTTPSLRFNEDKLKRSREILGSLKNLNPDRYSSFDIDKRASEIAQESRKNLEKVQQGSSGLLSTAASFAGGFAASAYDPLEVVTALIPFGTAKTVLGKVVAGAVENVAIEGAKQPGIIAWQKELGQEYGYKDVATNVGLAALFGGALPAGGAAAKKVKNKIFGTPVLDKAAKQTQTRTQERIKTFDVRSVGEAAAEANKVFEFENGKPRDFSSENVRTSEILDEASYNPNIDPEVRAALRDSATHVRNLEERPSFASSEEHTLNLTQLETAYNDGKVPTFEPEIADEFRPSRVGDADEFKKPFNKNTLKKLKNSGEVVTFNKSKGIGRVLDPNTGKTFDVDFKAIHTNRAFRNLKKGDKVKFNSEGGTVTNVARINESLRVRKPSAEVQPKVTPEITPERARANEQAREILGERAEPRKTREELIQESETQIRNSGTTQDLEFHTESLDEALIENPDLRVEFDGEELKVRDIKEKIDADKNILEALKSCKVS